MPNYLRHTLAALCAAILAFAPDAALCASPLEGGGVMLLGTWEMWNGGETPEVLPRSYMKVAIPSDSYEFRLTFAGSNVSIDWGDGTTVVATSSPATHHYNAGNYTVEIGDTCTRFECPQSYGRATITEVGFGESVTSIADAGYRYANSLVKIACAPSVTTVVNNTFRDCTNLDWVCDFPKLDVGSSRFSFLPTLSRQISHMGSMPLQKYSLLCTANMFAQAPVDLWNLQPSLVDNNTNSAIPTSNYYIRRIWLPKVVRVETDSFWGFPNLYGVYEPLATQINSCVTRQSSKMTNNPLRVTHMRLGHLDASYTPSFNRNLCWGGSENYLGVFMVDMTRAELSTFLSTFYVANFISQSAFNNKAICTDDPEWDAWEAWFTGGMEIDSVPTFPLNR